MNDPPTINVKNVTFNESTRIPINVFPVSLSIDDSDHYQLEDVIVEIYPNIDPMDNLTLPNITGLNITLETLPAATVSTCSPAQNDFTVQRLTLTGPANITVFENALRNVTYSNYCPGLVLEQRSIRVILRDSIDTNTVLSYIDISSFDDTPVCYFGKWPVSITS